MRFELNRPYWFIACEENHRPTPLHRYTPAATVSVVQVRCASHHKVATAWSDEADNDGFIFSDHLGQQWYNQYPRAAYGQLDTRQDYVIRRAAHDLPLSDDELLRVFAPHTEATTVLEEIARVLSLGPHPLILLKTAIEQKLQDMGVSVQYCPPSTALDKKLNLWSVVRGSAPQA